MPYKLTPTKLADKNTSPVKVEFFDDENGFSHFRVVRDADKSIIFDTSLGGFVYSDQLLQITTKLPSPYIYGFGENVS